MYLFCPHCGNLLVVEEGPSTLRFACNTCPYVQNITEKVTASSYRRFFISSPQFYVVKVSSVEFPKLKEVDDVLGGQAAWENVDTTEGIVNILIES